ncbi:MAG: CPBP family intramembrane glutamic endopeptidase [Cyanobacteriota bacterium]|nr:CPBP family intramembrane glutamic endopeptidase [Cyanobacteriota bacterium]
MSILLTWPFPLRFLTFLLVLVLGWLPIAALLWLSIPPARDYVWIPLYAWLLILLWQWGSRVWRYERPFISYGLTGDPLFRQELGLGLLLGVVGLFLLFGLQGWLGWLEWQPIEGMTLILTLGVGLVLGLGVALVEELVFRGWLLNELRQDYGLWRGAFISALIFAIAHFLKPLPQTIESWPQFPGLWIMGWLLVEARQERGDRLSLGMGLHAGWIWGITLVNTLGWVEYTQRVPAWVTGVGGNPLAGILGVLFLLLTSQGLKMLPNRLWPAGE